MSKPILPPLSLYIHIPWCIRKCPYCDFNSHAVSNGIPEKEYLENLLADFDQDIDFVQARPIESIFIGGGTPSLFSPEAYKFLLENIADRIEIKKDAEVTLEANPGATESSYYAGFADAGINRLSMGIQSFSDQKLNILGRVHSSSEAIEAIGLATKAGFDQINLDLMFGLPGQSLAEALQDLEAAISFNPQHLSWYQLTIEPNTEFYSKPPLLPDDEAIFQIQKQGISLLSKEGYERYEVSAFARNKSFSRHNLNYWQFGDYIGIGAGAHGKITLINHDDTFNLNRYWKTRSPADYLDPQKKYFSGSKEIALEERPLDFLMNALRLPEGFNSALFRERTGLSLDTVSKQLKDAKDAGMLDVSEKNFKASETGYLYLNDLLKYFL